MYTKNLTTFFTIIKLTKFEWFSSVFIIDVTFLSTTLTIHYINRCIIFCAYRLHKKKESESNANECSKDSD